MQERNLKDFFQITFHLPFFFLLRDQKASSTLTKLATLDPHIRDLIQWFSTVGNSGPQGRMATSENIFGSQDWSEDAANT